MNSQTETPPPLFRSTDPRTSIDAAIRASRASRRAVDALGRLFATGVNLTDEEAHEELWTTGKMRVSADLIRHARKALELAGMIVDTGETRPTKYGSASRVWRMA